jgi:hypothetical protein
MFTDTKVFTSRKRTLAAIRQSGSLGSKQTFAAVVTKVRNGRLPVCCAREMLWHQHPSQWPFSRPLPAILSIPAPDPAAAKDPAAVVVVKHTSLSGCDAFFGCEQFDFGSCS